MQPVFLDDVLLQPVQVAVGQQLPGEEARAAQAFETAAGRAGRTRIRLHAFACTGGKS
jgi:hypothetical protein